MVSSFNPNTNNNLNNYHQQQQQQQTPQMTTDALIINSNSNVVSEEILIQLKEQFGDNKQIFILNSSNNSISASSSSTALISSTTPIQYLIVDKDIDINTILQDPNIFNQTNLNQKYFIISDNVSGHTSQSQVKTILPKSSSFYTDLTRHN